MILFLNEPWNWTLQCRRNPKRQCYSCSFSWNKIKEIVTQYIPMSLKFEPILCIVNYIYRFPVTILLSRVHSHFPKHQLCFILSHFECRISFKSGLAAREGLVAPFLWSLNAVISENSPNAWWFSVCDFSESPCCA